MQSRKHQVAGEGGFDGDFRGFEVTDFADQDDVGILTQKERSAAAKFNPICSFICTWFTPPN